MSIRDDIDEARRLWAVYIAIRDARRRADTARVREALSAEESYTFSKVSGEYRDGRDTAMCGGPPSANGGIALAGWCDEMLTRLRGES